MSDGDLKSKSWLYKLEDSYDFVLETLKNRFTESFMLLLEDYKKNNEQYQTVFLDRINLLLQKGFKAQEKNKKNRIASLSVFFLNSIIITKDYRIQINLYDKRLYMDDNDIYETWDVSSFMKYYEDDIQYLNQTCRRNIYHWEYKEYQLIRKAYAEAYSEIIKMCLVDWMPSIVNLQSYQDIKKEEEVIFLYGKYLEKLEMIYKRKEEKEGSLCVTT